MYDDASTRRDDARRNIEELAQADNPPDFRRLFNASVASIRSIPEVIGVEGKRYFRKNDRSRTGAFSKWHDAQLRDARNDELISFVINARNKDLHEGRYAIAFATHVTEFSAGPDTPGRPPNSIVQLGSEGAYWVVDPGEPSERREIIRHPGITSAATLVNPPTTHLGLAVSVTPFSVLELAEKYFARTLHEAKTTFPY